MKITEEKLLKLGFTLEYIEGYKDYYYKGVSVWEYNKKYWIINMLDQGGIEIEYKTLEELNVFFSAINRPLPLDKLEEYK
jgi:hypothetical protein